MGYFIDWKVLSWSDPSHTKVTLATGEDILHTSSLLYYLNGLIGDCFDTIRAEVFVVFV